MSEIALGFVLSLTLLLSVGAAVLSWLSWKETRKTRPALAQGLRVMADLVEAQARQVHVDPTLTGAPTLRALASEAEHGVAAVARRPAKQDGPRPARMRPLSDEEEWALEQERKGFAGLDDADMNKARNWASKAREDRLATVEE